MKGIHLGKLGPGSVKFAKAFVELGYEPAAAINMTMRLFRVNNPLF